MASENETVADVAKQMRRNEEVFHHLYWCEYADRIEAAHRREVAELRECLKEAVHERCEKMCTPTALTTKNEIIRNFCDNECKYRKWRKTLEGAKDEGK